MKKYRIWLVIGCAVLAGLMVWVNYPSESPAASTQYASNTNKPATAESSTKTLHISHNPVAHPTTESQYKNIDKPREEVIEVYIPPIAEPTHAPSYQGDLNDHEQYQAFAETQERQLKQQYIDAATDKIKRLEALLARGRAEGISKEQLDFAQQKIAGIKAMSEELRMELVQQ
ncbi:hypothetical protein [Pseudoalteromonas sp. MMG022]|uniref:hypothetical protein n=1 Tax=Pseudoalteromonas sp. MMG022 TaxID=2909978 RepID=UPI001F29141E|nr:hypothetical protein [Pseudoalteromonas sp. MMG022]MCF6435954.1 hypothetical protein [Pseudoalteromonas sp. MMG022]